jgi:hypothetical protein
MSLTLNHLNMPDYSGFATWFWGTGVRRYYITNYFGCSIVCFVGVVCYKTQVYDQNKMLIYAKYCLKIKQ